MDSYQTLLRRLDSVPGIRREMENLLRALLEASEQHRLALETMGGDDIDGRLDALEQADVALAQADTNMDGRVDTLEEITNGIGHHVDNNNPYFMRGLTVNQFGIRMSNAAENGLNVPFLDALYSALGAPFPLVQPITLRFYDPAEMNVAMPGMVDYELRPNTTDHCLDFHYKGVTLQVGQEFLIMGFNKSAVTTIKNGQPISFVRSTGLRVEVEPTNLIDAGSCRCFMGLATQDIPPQTEGFITRLGAVRAIDTRGTDTTFSVGGENWTDGDRVWVATGGKLTNVEPTSGRKLLAGMVIDAANSGSIFSNPREFELSGDVVIGGTFFTPIGGQAVMLANHSTNDIPHGTALVYDSAYDMAVVPADPATSLGQFTVIGWAYGVIPRKQGQTPGEGWVVRKGTVEGLLEDGVGSARNSWMRLSPTVPGRVVAFSGPGFEKAPTAPVFTRGSSTSDVSVLALADSVRWVGEEQSSPAGVGYDFYFRILPGQVMDALKIIGEYVGSGGHSVALQLWDWTAGGGAGAWEATFATMPNGGTATYTAALLAKHLKADATNEIRVRFYHASNGINGHRLYLDQVIATASAQLEHFKECGHSMTAVTAGVNKLAKFDIHFL